MALAACCINFARVPGGGALVGGATLGAFAKGNGSWTDCGAGSGAAGGFAAGIDVERAVGQHAQCHVQLVDIDPRRLDPSGEQGQGIENRDRPWGRKARAGRRDA